MEVNQWFNMITEKKEKQYRTKKGVEALNR